MNFEEFLMALNFDIGLLGCMLDLPVRLIYSQDYGIAKGYLAENFVTQEFAAADVSRLYSWTEGTSILWLFCEPGYCGS